MHSEHPVPFGAPSTGHGHGEVLFERDGLKVSQIVLEAGEALPKHAVADDLVVIVTRGTGVFDIDGEIQTVSVGDVLDLKPGALHSIDAYDRFEFVVVAAARPVRRAL